MPARVVRRTAAGVGVPALAAASLLALAAPASAHAEFASSDPVSGSRVTTVPTAVTIRFSEDVAAASTARVLDGCGRAVGGAARVRGATVQVPVAGAQPGRWSVAWQNISDDDGHPESGAFSFTVAGTPSCASDSPAPAPAPADSGSAEESPAASPLAASGADRPSGGGASGLLVLLGASAVLVGGGFAARRALSGRDR